MTDEFEAPADQARPPGFFDCRGTWHSLAEEPTTLESFLESRC